MPKFAYAAIDATARPSKASPRPTRSATRAHLLDQNLYPVKIEEKRGALQFELTQAKVKKKELMHFTRQLAVFVKAGIPLTEALEIIGDETTDVALQRTITDMVEDLRNGGTLSGAAGKHPEAFPTYYIGILGRPSSPASSTRRSTAWPATSSARSRPGRRSSRRCPTRASSWCWHCSPSPCSPATCCRSSSRCSKSSTPTCRFATRALLFVADLFTVLWYIPFTF
jgi:hypothetical protein